MEPVYDLNITTAQPNCRYRVLPEAGQSQVRAIPLCRTHQKINSVNSHLKRDKPIS